MHSFSRVWIPGILKFLVVYVPLFSGAEAQTKLPSQQDVQGIRDACGGGVSKKVTGDVDAKVQLWRQQGEAKGSASISDLAGILGALPSDRDVNPEIYKLYTSCVLQMTDQYLRGQSETNRADRLVSALDLGFDIGYYFGSFLQNGSRPGQAYLIVGGAGLGDGRPFLSGEVYKINEDLRRLGAEQVAANGMTADAKLYFRLWDAARVATRQEDLQTSLEVGRRLGALCRFEPTGYVGTGLPTSERLIIVDKLNSLNVVKSSQMLNAGQLNFAACQRIMASIKGEFRHYYSQTR